MHCCLCTAVNYWRLQANTVWQGTLSQLCIVLLCSDQGALTGCSFCRSVAPYSTDSYFKSNFSTGALTIICWNAVILVNGILVGIAL